MDERRGIRVVLCAPGFPTSIDDADKPFLLNHGKALSMAGAQVTVVCPMVNGMPSRQQLGDIEVIRVRYAPRRMQTLASTGSMYREATGLKNLLVVPMLLCLMATMARQLRQKNSVAYGHWWVPGGLVAVIAAFITRRPSVVYLHGSDAAITTTKTLRTIASVVMRMADSRIAVSDELASWGESISSREFTVLPMPIDLERLPRPSPAPQDGLILGVGRLVPEKGFDLLIEAVALIDQQVRPEITIVGVGSERSRLDSQARRLGVSLHLPGAVSPREIGDWYDRASFVVVPSRREGFGLVAAEASAAGRAVVATKVGALPQIVEDRVSGVLVEPENPQALMEALKVVKPSWGEKGPSKVAKLSFEAHGQQLRRLCEDLLQ